MVGLEVAQVEVVVELVGRGERGAVDGLEVGEGFLVVRVAGGDGVEGFVGPAVVEAAVAQAGGPGGGLLHRVVPLAGEEIGEAPGRRGRRARIGRMLMRKQAQAAAQAPG